jgi:hypothetical protein
LVPAPPPKADRVALRPTLVTEELPPTPLAAVSVPEPVRMATTQGARADSIDVHQLPPLPVLAQSVQERATLDDVTADVSTVMVLSARMPLRLAPAPFVRLAIPDPFENRRPLTLLVPPEPGSPLTGSPQVPRP